MNDTDNVVIEIREGTVVEAYSSRNRVRVVPIDWDEIRENGEVKGSVYPPCGLDRMPSDTKEAFSSTN
jgi:hypothetical protein